MKNEQRRIERAFSRVAGFCDLKEDFENWEHFDLYRHAERTLRYDVLYQSHMHGAGHIERVMLLGAMIAMKQNFSAADTALLLDICAYHDTGRIDDTKDDDHGSRSADNAAAITGRRGEELAIVRATMCAHSVSDKIRSRMFEKCHVTDKVRADRMTDALKDADALDRVRLGDLDVRYLRTDAARGLTDFAQALYDAYIAEEET